MPSRGVAVQIERTIFRQKLFEQNEAFEHELKVLVVRPQIGVLLLLEECTVTIDHLTTQADSHLVVGA